MNKKLSLMITILFCLAPLTSYATVTLVENKKMRKVKDIEVDQMGQIWLVSGNSLAQWDPTDFRGKVITQADRRNRIIINKQTGEWTWFTGIKAVVSHQGTVKGGGFSGLWKKQQNGFAIEWPIVDQIDLSKQGNQLRAKNQFGAVSATRDLSCSGK